MDDRAEPDPSAGSSITLWHSRETMGLCLPKSTMNKDWQPPPPAMNHLSPPSPLFHQFSNTGATMSSILAVNALTIEGPSRAGIEQYSGGPTARQLADCMSTCLLSTELSAATTERATGCY